MQFGQYPAARHTIAHLSDPHLLAGGARQYDVVDPDIGLALALARIARLDPLPQALVFTGDLADKAEPEAYARLRSLVEPIEGPGQPGLGVDGAVLQPVGEQVRVADVCDDVARGGVLTELHPNTLGRSAAPTGWLGWPDPARGGRR